VGDSQEPVKIVRSAEPRFGAAVVT